MCSQDLLCLRLEREDHCPQVYRYIDAWKILENIQDTIEGDHVFRNRTRGAGVEENPFFIVYALFFLLPYVCFIHTNKKSQITHKGEPRFPV